MRVASLFALALPLLTLPACGSAKELVKDPGGQAAPPPIPESFTNKCDAAKGQLRPLVVEWDAPDRAALEAQSRQGQLVVHYEGCAFEVLRRCKAPKRFVYTYTGITPKDEVVSMSNVKELYASIPVHAAKFEGKLAAGSKLSAEMRIVGEFGVVGATPAIDQLEGDCQGATHVVTALTFGAWAACHPCAANRTRAPAASGAPSPSARPRTGARSSAGCRACGAPTTPPTAGHIGVEESRAARQSEEAERRGDGEPESPRRDHRRKVPGPLPARGAASYQLWATAHG